MAAAGDVIAGSMARANAGGNHRARAGNCVVGARSAMARVAGVTGRETRAKRAPAVAISPGVAVAVTRAMADSPMAVPVAPIGDVVAGVMARRRRS
jgi:hypothetical protein